MGSAMPAINAGIANLLMFLKLIPVPKKSFLTKVHILKMRKYHNH
jgi:hypothetical protein